MSGKGSSRPGRSPRNRRACANLYAKAGEAGDGAANWRGMSARMQTARRRRTTWAIAASLIAHVAVGVFLLAQHPRLLVPVETQGPPQAIIPVLLMPRTPPPAAGKVAP